MRQLALAMSARLTDMERFLQRLGDRIRAVREAQNLSQTELGQLIGVSKQTVSQWERGISPPLVTNLVRLAAVTEVGVASLLEDLDNALDSGDPALVRTRLSARMVPLRRWEQPLDRETPAADAGRMEFVASNFPHGPRAFALRLQNNSMVPRFQPGDLIVIDPATQTDPGTFVLAHAQEQIFFRRFRPTRQGTSVGAELLALNSDWPAVVMTAEDTIIGTLTEHIARA